MDVNYLSLLRQFTGTGYVIRDLQTENVRLMERNLLLNAAPASLPLQVGGVVSPVQPAVCPQQVLGQHVVGHHAKRQAPLLRLE